MSSPWHAGPLSLLLPSPGYAAALFPHPWWVCPHVFNEAAGELLSGTLSNKATLELSSFLPSVDLERLDPSPNPTPLQQPQLWSGSLRDTAKQEGNLHDLIQFGRLHRPLEISHYYS